MTSMQDGLGNPAESSGLSTGTQADMDVIIRDEGASRLDFAVLASMHGEDLIGPNSSRYKPAKPMAEMDTIVEEEGSVKANTRESPATASALDRDAVAEHRIQREFQQLELKSEAQHISDGQARTPFAQPAQQRGVENPYSLRSRSASDSVFFLEKTDQMGNNRDNVGRPMRQAKSLGRPTASLSRKSSRLTLSPKTSKSSPCKGRAHPKARSSKRLPSKQKSRQRNFAMDFTNDPGSATPCSS